MPSPTCKRHHARAPRAEWLRVVAGYLVAVFLLQGLAAAIQLGAGPLHRHHGTPVTLATLLFAHHEHAHASGERHHHQAADASVVAVQEPGTTDTLTAPLCSALTLLAVGLAVPWAAPMDTGVQVQQATPPWAWHTAPARTLYRPPWLA